MSPILASFVGRVTGPAAVPIPTIPPMRPPAGNPHKRQSTGAGFSVGRLRRSVGRSVGVAADRVSSYSESTTLQLLPTNTTSKAIDGRMERSVYSTVKWMSAGAGFSGVLLCHTQACRHSGEEHVLGCGLHAVERT